MSFSFLAEASWHQQSSGGNFFVKLHPPEPIVIGRFQSWQMTVLDKNQQPVYPLKVHVSGGMEAHGHGLPTAPKVTRYLGEGRYLIEGVQFNMAGEWLLKLLLESEQTREQVDFEFTLSW